MRRGVCIQETDVTAVLWKESLQLVLQASIKHQRTFWGEGQSKEGCFESSGLQVRAHASLDSRESKYRCTSINKNQYAGLVNSAGHGTTCFHYGHELGFSSVIRQPTEGKRGAFKIQLCQSWSQGSRNIVNKMKVWVCFEKQCWHLADAHGMALAPLFIKALLDHFTL